MALANGYNAGFVRPDSSLHVIVLSDENDYSDNISNVDWVAWLQAEQGIRPAVSITSIVGLQMGPAVVEIGTDYINATTNVGGILWDIGDPNYDQALEQIGIDSSGLMREFELSTIPVVESIEVEVDEDGVIYQFQADVDWVYDAEVNAIRFLEFIPSPLAIIRVSYQIATEE